MLPDGYTACATCNRVVFENDVNEAGLCVGCAAPVVDPTAVFGAGLPDPLHGPSEPSVADAAPTTPWLTNGVTEAPTGTSEPGEGTDIPAADDHNTGSQAKLD